MVELHAAFSHFLQDWDCANLLTETLTKELGVDI